ncbi:fumarylacetoacetase, partial [Sulfitobacter sp. M22298]
MTLMTSWVESANSATTDFPLNNLPYGVFSTNQLEARCGVAIGDQILDMAALEEEGLITLAEEPVFDVPYWNDVMDLG